jgi:hypothetical protein
VYAAARRAIQRTLAAADTFSGSFRPDLALTIWDDASLGFPQSRNPHRIERPEG